MNGEQETRIPCREIQLEDSSNRVEASFSACTGMRACLLESVMEISAYGLLARGWHTVSASTVA
jgi:hypothetical protein